MSEEESEASAFKLIVIHNKLDLADGNVFHVPWVAGSRALHVEHAGGDIAHLWVEHSTATWPADGEHQWMMFELQASGVPFDFNPDVAYWRSFTIDGDAIHVYQAGQIQESVPR